MINALDQTPRREPVRQDSPRDGQEGYRRQIDCAPRQGGPEPVAPGTGRGRGVPEPRQWVRGREGYGS